MIVGGWTIRPTLHEGELLSSYLLRCAHAHGSTPYRFLHLFWPGRAIWNRDLDRNPDEAWLGELSAASGVAAGRLRDATITDLRSRLDASPRKHGDSRFVLSAGVYHRTRRRHAMQYCPECLDTDDPWWRKQWRLAFVVCCDQHGTRLADACPACDVPVIPHRTMPTFAGQCHACGRRLVASGTDDPVREAPKPVARLQATLSTVLSTPAESTFLGCAFAPDTFAFLRQLVGIVLDEERFYGSEADTTLTVDGPALAERRSFERLRIDERIRILGLLEPWVRDWPTGFRERACAMRLTRRRFLGRKWPENLEIEIARLSEGIARKRSGGPPLHDAELRSLRRHEPIHYRQVRAEKLMTLAGRASR